MEAKFLSKLGFSFIYRSIACGIILSLHIVNSSFPGVNATSLSCPPPLKQGQKVTVLCIVEENHKQEIKCPLRKNGFSHKRKERQQRRENFIHISFEFTDSSNNVMNRLRSSTTGTRSLGSSSRCSDREKWVNDVRCLRAFQEDFTFGRIFVYQYRFTVTQSHLSNDVILQCGLKCGLDYAPGMDHLFYPSSCQIHRQPDALHSRPSPKRFSQSTGVVRKSSQPQFVEFLFSKARSGNPERLYTPWQEGRAKAKSLHSGTPISKSLIFEGMPRSKSVIFDEEVRSESVKFEGKPESNSIKFEGEIGPKSIQSKGAPRSKFIKLPSTKSMQSEVKPWEIFYKFMFEKAAKTTPIKMQLERKTRTKTEAGSNRGVAAEPSKVQSIRITGTRMHKVPFEKSGGTKFKNIRSKRAAKPRSNSSLFIRKEGAEFKEVRSRQAAKTKPAMSRFLQTVGNESNKVQFVMADKVKANTFQYLRRRRLGSSSARFERAAKMKYNVQVEKTEGTDSKTVRSKRLAGTESKRLAGTKSKRDHSLRRDGKIDSSKVRAQRSTRYNKAGRTDSKTVRSERFSGTKSERAQSLRRAGFDSSKIRVEREARYNTATEEGDSLLQKDLAGTAGWREGVRGAVSVAASSLLLLALIPVFCGFCWTKKPPPPTKEPSLPPDSPVDPTSMPAADNPAPPADTVDPNPSEPRVPAVVTFEVDSTDVDKGEHTSKTFNPRSVSVFVSANSSNQFALTQVSEAVIANKQSNVHKVSNLISNDIQEGPPEPDANDAANQADKE